MYNNKYWWCVSYPHIKQGEIDIIWQSKKMQVHVWCSDTTFWMEKVTPTTLLVVKYENHALLRIHLTFLVNRLHFFFISGKFEVIIIVCALCNLVRKKLINGIGYIYDVHLLWPICAKLPTHRVIQTALNLVDSIKLLCKPQPLLKDTSLKESKMNSREKVSKLSPSSSKLFCT